MDMVNYCSDPENNVIKKKILTVDDVGLNDDTRS